MQRQAKVREQIKKLNARLDESRDVVSLLETVARTGKTLFWNSRFDDLARDHVPVERFGCWVRGILALVLLSASYALIYSLAYSPSIVAYPIATLLATSLLCGLAKRARRRKAAKERLPDHRSLVARLEQQVQELESTLPSSQGLFGRADEIRTRNVRRGFLPRVPFQAVKALKGTFAILSGLLINLVLWGGFYWTMLNFGHLLTEPVVVVWAALGLFLNFRVLGWLGSIDDS